MESLVNWALFVVVYAAYCFAMCMFLALIDPRNK